MGRGWWAGQDGPWPGGKGGRGGQGEVGQGSILRAPFVFHSLSDRSEGTQQPVTKHHTL